MAPAATLVVWTFLDMMRSGKPTAVGCATAIVVGLVAVTPAAGFISPMSAIALGAIAAVPSYLALIIRAKTSLDDSLDVVAAHGVGGSLWVSRVIVTHCHPDHAGNAHWLTHRFGADLWVSLGEYFAAHAIGESRAGFSVEYQLDLLRRNGLEKAWLERMKERRGNYRRNVPEFPSAFCRLMDRQSLTIGARRWTVIMGYGHSAEHAALYCESLGVLISGDMVLPKITTNISVSTVEPEGNPLRLFLDSLDRYAALPADTLVLPSHGLPFRGIRERIAQLKEHHRLRLDEVEQACVSPKSAADIVPTLFRRELDTFQMYFAMGESMAHLHFLHAEGRLERRIGADGVLRYAQA